MLNKFVSRSIRTSLLRCRCNASNQPRHVPEKIDGSDQSSTSTKHEDFKTRSEFVASKIIEKLSDNKNRLFAVVFINGRQYKVSDGDIIVVEQSIPLDFGERIKFEKVLLVGGSEFTLLGRPILDPQMASVEATVVEKTTSQPEIDYVRKDGKQIMITNWKSKELTTLRINNIIVDTTQIQSV